MARRQRSIVLTALYCMITASALGEEPALTPLLAQPGELLFSDDFDRDTIKPQWKPLHKTRWSIANGTLQGIPATEEYQKSRTKHNGGTPSMTLVVPARDCILQMSFMLSGKMKGAHFGFNDGTAKNATGHVCRVTFDARNGTKLIKDKSSKVEGDVDEVLATSDWAPKLNKWHTLLFEARGDQIVVQVKGGPTLRGQPTDARRGDSFL